MKIGACHVETPLIEVGQLSTALYFSYFLIIVPIIGLFENTLTDLNFVGGSLSISQGRKNVVLTAGFFSKLNFTRFFF